MKKINNFIIEKLKLNKQTQINSDGKIWLSDFFELIRHHFNSIESIKKLKKIEDNFYNCGEELFIYSYEFLDDNIDDYLNFVGSKLKKDSINKLVSYNLVRKLISFIQNYYDKQIEFMEVRALVDNEEGNLENAILLIILEKWDREKQDWITGSELFMISANTDIKKCIKYIQRYDVKKMKYGPETVFTNDLMTNGNLLNN